MNNKKVQQTIGRNCGEDTLAHWPTASGMMTVDEAACEVLKYLDKIWGSLSSSGKSSLLDRCCFHRHSLLYYQCQVYGTLNKRTKICAKMKIYFLCLEKPCGHSVRSVNIS